MSLDDLKEIRAAWKPFFDERRAIDAEKSPAIVERLTAMGVSVDSIGGNCTVQAEGEIGENLKFYFWARGDSWQLHITEKSKSFIAVSRGHDFTGARVPK